MRFSLAALIFILTACGGSPAPQSKTLPSTDELNKRQQERFERTPRPPMILWGQTEEALSNYQFKDCEDCSKAFGQLVSMKEEVDGTLQKPARKIISGNCQGAFVAKNLFLTSRHCLPGDIREVGKDCSQRIQVIMPALGELPSEVISCKKISDLTLIEGLEDKVPQPDWALLEMDMDQSERLQAVQKEGLADKEKLLAWLPLENPETKKITIEKLECETIQQSLRLPEYLENKSPIVLMKCNRDITKGFSGTVLYKESEEGLKATAVLSHLWDAQINHETILVSQFIVASNMSCLPEEGQELPESCGFKADGREKLQERIVVDQLTSVRDQILKELKEFLNNKKQPVQWEVTPLDEISTLPKGYPEYLEALKKVNNPNLKPEKQKHFFQTMIPVFAKCVRKEVRAKTPRSKAWRGQVPVISLSLVPNAYRQVKSQYQIKMFPIEVMVNRDDPNTFVMAARGHLMEFQRPENRLMAERFSHLSAQIPPCP